MAESGHGQQLYAVDLQRGTVEARLSAITATPRDDMIGDALAVSGNTLVIGAPGEDNGKGAVYVFIRHTDTTWTQQPHLVESNSDPGDQFGGTVALLDDMLVERVTPTRATIFRLRSR